MRVRKVCAWLAAITISVLMCLPTHAALVGGDYLATGDRLLVKDTDTGLEWLTLGQTRGPLQTSQGASVNQILNGFGGFVQEGFQFATLAQVEQLFENAGIVDFSSAFNSDNAAGAKLLVSLFGSVTAHPDPSIGVVQGFAGVDLNSGTAFVPAVALFLANSQFNSSNSDIAATGCFAGAGCAFGLDSTPSVGAFLVRLSDVQAVPEPGSLAMVASGICVLCLVRRRIAKPSLQISQ